MQTGGGLLGLAVHAMDTGHHLPIRLSPWSLHYVLHTVVWLPGQSAVGGPTLALLASLCSCHLVLWHTRAPGKLLTLLSAHCWESILKEDHSGFYIRKSKLRCVAPSSSSSVYHLIILSSVGSLEKVQVKLKLCILTIQVSLTSTPSF